MSGVGKADGGLPALGPRGEGWVILQGGLFMLIAAAGITGRRRLRRPRPLSMLLTASGLGLTAAGALMSVRGTTDLRESLTALPRPKADARLIETGVYGLVRHPIYGGIVLASIGWALVRRTLRSAAVAALALAFFDTKARREEAWLEEAYEGYPDYRRRTRKLIPFVR